jgi:hypothetical protein
VLLLTPSQKSLPDLPNEILLQIFSEFSPRSLVPLSLVNRRFNALCAPLVYSHWIADPNTFCALPIATKVPLRHLHHVKHLSLWGQHPNDGFLAFSQCPNLLSISWDIGPDTVDARYFSTTYFSDDFMLYVHSLSLELRTCFRGVMYLDSKNPFQWFRDCFSRCRNLRSLRLRPTPYDLPPTTEFVPFGPPVAREHELLDVVSELFGSTLEELTFEWCPPYRTTAPNFLIDSALADASCFPVLKTLRIPFSSTKKILYHAFLICQSRPGLQIHDLRGAGASFTPLLADLCHLRPAQIEEYYHWLATTFPAWNRQFLYPEGSSSSDPEPLIAAVKDLASLHLPFGLKHYVTTLRWGPGFSTVVAAAKGVESVALEVPRRLQQAARWEVSRGPARWEEWARAHLEGLDRLEELGIVGAWEGILEDVGAEIRRLGVTRLEMDLPWELVGGLRDLREFVAGLVVLSLRNVSVDDENLGELVRAMPRLRMLRLRGLRGEGMEMGRLYAAVPERCMIVLELGERK